MSIKLKKGENISLTKEVPGLKKIIVGLGWDVNENDDETDFDLDASAFMIETGVSIKSSVLSKQICYPSGR